MQGAAGIAAYLFRLARVLEQGREACRRPHGHLVGAPGVMAGDARPSAAV
jgi:hypothetical protein